MAGRRPFESLYIHVPFCHGKCDYCAFYSLGRYGRPEQDAYLRRMLMEMAERSSDCATLRSVFFGGGTPTALDDDLFERLLDSVRSHFRFSEDTEWTIEANPESLSEEKIAIMASHGVTRLSMGIQSFAPRTRMTLGRRGHLEGLESKVDAIRKAGIRHVNFDFIYNVPGQTPDDFRMDLRKALMLRPDHVSAYALTIEEGTALAKHETAVDDDDFLEFWRLADDILAEGGLRRYEISNFAKSDCKCRHNNDIWHGATYLGIGPAATSFDGMDRWTQVSDLRKWLDGDTSEMDILPPDKRDAEILAFGMRTVDGWTWRQFAERTGVDAKSLRGKEISRLQQLGLVMTDDNGFRPTARGLLFNDEIVMELL